MTTWYCTWCGNPHDPDTTHLVEEVQGRRLDLGGFTNMDPRYSLGWCGKTIRALVQDPAVARRQAETVGALRPKTKAPPKPRKRPRR
jgi:hypothetical protein